MEAKIKVKKGWHKLSKTAPHRGKGSATVEPLRKLSDIRKIAFLLRDNCRDYALFICGINLGLRGTDLLNLKWRDVISDDFRIAQKLYILESKNQKKRNIALSKKVRSALNRLKESLGEEQFELGNFIFPSQKGENSVMSVQRLHQLVNSWCSQCKIKGNFGGHTLRKTFGFWHYKRGIDISLLMEIFGHGSEKTTLRYIGIEQKRIDEANLRLDLG
jgi:integrase